MISKKKFISAILAISIVAALAVGGTLAYLTDKTEKVTNTFTVGKVDIKLDESKLGENGLDTTTRVQANSYKLIPGTTYGKDPVITVETGSEPCYLFVKVTNKTAATYLDYTMLTGWTAVNGAEDVYYFNATKSAGETVKLLTNDQVKVKDIVGSESLAMPTTDVTLAFEAYAVQAANFTNATDAWNATFGAAGNGSGDNTTEPANP